MPSLRKFSLYALLAAMAVAQVQCGTENPLGPLLRGPNEVWIQSTGYDPPTLTIAPGTTVTWINKDSRVHDVTSGTPGNPDPDAFTSSESLTASDPDYGFTFSRTGSFPYYCTVHPSKRGTIVVRQ